MALEAGRGPTGTGSETEAKASYKTTELLVYLLAFAGILVASKTISAEDGQTDWFRAHQAWLYITLLTTVYMVSRGLAKSGRGEPGTSRGAESEGVDPRPAEDDQGSGIEPVPPEPARSSAPREEASREQEPPLSGGPAGRQEVSESPPARREAALSRRPRRDQTLELPPDGQRRERENGPPDQFQYETGETNLANVAVALGAAGLVSLVFTFGALFFLALPLGLAAMVLGRLASRRSERLEGAPGSGRARAAWILGSITTLLSALVLMLVVLGVAVVEQFI